MSILPLLFFILPLGLDTLGVSISLGIKSQRDEIAVREGKGPQIPAWLNFDLLYRREATHANAMWQADHTPLDV